MRYFGLVLGLVLICHQSALAQQNQQQQVQPPLGQPEANARLDMLLAQWEAKMTGIKSIKAQIARESEDKAFHSKEVMVGNAYYQAPNLARLELKRPDNPNKFECIVCTGQFTYQYIPDQKLIRVYDLGPAKKGQLSEDNFLSFLIGMKAAEAKKRYILKLVKEDVNYVYIEVKPRDPRDMADFSLAQLALTQKTFLPRMLIYTAGNGSVATWNIPSLEVDTPLDRRYFEQPGKPPGWELKRILPEPKPDPNAGAPPRIMRQQGP